ncbi:hypothetical protein DSLASN_12710 [Desulfoluna limicola]|uniref:Histidine kinase n=1 Tax=Desulfoluna limicola TaxID=2810562 RepID=A0ABN6F0Y9_9BACT|nr:hypothetical protein DSLASN_12710 [Desulfoluna limicola]
MLLVDDEEGIRRVLALLLADLGYRVVTAANGQEAMAGFVEAPCPVVLTDIKMPVMDGIALLKKVKTQRPETEVIMLTGHGDLSLAIESLRLDAVDFLTKPVNEALLEMAMKRAFDKVALEYALKEHTDHLERLVEEKSRALVEAETLAAVGEAVSDVAHAVKGITSALKAGIYVVEEGIETHHHDTLLSGWGVVKRNVERAGRLVGNLLEAGRAGDYQFEPLDLSGAVADALGLAHLRAASLTIRLTSSVEPGLPMICGDREALVIAFTNLLENAMDALENREEEGTIAVDLKQDPNGILLSVTDSAGSMGEALQQMAFHRKISTKRWKGTGIGLMVTARIAEAHNAMIEVASDKQVGTCVRLWFPV